MKQRIEDTIGTIRLPPVWSLVIVWTPYGLWSVCRLLGAEGSVVGLIAGLAMALGFLVWSGWVIRLNWRNKWYWATIGGVVLLALIASLVMRAVEAIS